MLDKKELKALQREPPEHLPIVQIIIRDCTIYINNGELQMANLNNLGNIGNINFQGLQIAQSIDAHIGELSNKRETEDVGNALRALTKAMRLTTHYQMMLAKTC